MPCWRHTASKGANMNKKTARKEIAPLAGRAKAKQLDELREKYKGEREQLQQRILSLAARLSGLGVGAEVYGLSIVELRGLYAFLMRLAGE